MERILIVELKFPQLVLVELCVGQTDLERPECGPARLPRKSVSLVPRNGDSLGVHGVNIEAGTLGGWLTLKFPEPSEKRLKVAMTVNHLVYAQKEMTGPVVHSKPVDHTKLSGKINIIIPTALDRDFAINHYTQRLNGQLDEQTQLIEQSELNRLQRLKAQPVIGPVLYSSGVRKNATVSRMDWTLLQAGPTWSWTANIPPPATSFSALAISRSTE